MSEVQFDLAALGLIILINIIITLLYKKYSRLEEHENKSANLAHHSSMVSVTPGSFMPRVPFLILYRSKNKQVRKLIIVHNLLCVLVYGIFAFAIFSHF